MLAGLCIVDANIGASAIVMLGADTPSPFNVIVDTVVVMGSEFIVKLASAVKVSTGK